MTSRSRSSHGDYHSSRYGNAYRAGKQRWRIADTKAPFDLHELIDDFSSWYERVVDSCGCQFSTSMDADLPRHFHGNPLMLGFLLWDMGSYSRNFLEGKGVDLDIFSKPIGGDWYSVGFLLMVSGTGSRREKAGKLHPGGSSRNRVAGDQAGTNLYYAGVIAGILNGSVNVRNASGVGTEFTAEICLQKSAG